MKLPIHRWYRFPAGFHAEWVKKVINESKSDEKITVFDPFLGSGTTVIASEETNVKGVGIEAHPLIYQIASSKLHWRSDMIEFNSKINEIVSLVSSLPSKKLEYPKLVHKMYSESSLDQLDKIRRAWGKTADETPATKLTWLAMLSILRYTSKGGTAPWTYVLPNKTKKDIPKPLDAFKNQCKMMKLDCLHFQSKYLESPRGVIYQDDARSCSTVKDNEIDLVITSPPYANNYDYADATRLELSFLGEIERWADLHNTVRQYLVRACSQHMKSSDKLDELLSNPKLEPIYDELSEKCLLLEKKRELHRGRKRYHTMVAAYFSDLADTWYTLRRVTNKEGKICFVIGDSAPYGVHLPVERWFGEIAIAAGFNEYYFEKIRTRNIKWKLDRKHKVLLKEGNLWVR